MSFFNIEKGSEHVKIKQDVRIISWRYFMNFIKKTLSALLAVSATASSLVIPAYANEVHNVNGTPTAFIAKFGKVNYGGKAHTAFKDFASAAQALGKNGGVLAFNSGIDLQNHTDIADRGTLVFSGISTVNSGSPVSFGELTEYTLSGDTVFDNITIQNIAGFVLDTADNNLTITEKCDTHYTLTYPENAKVYNDEALPSITAGGGSYANINAGKFDFIGTSGGTGSTKINIGDATANTVYSGLADGSSAFDGNIYTKISDGTVSAAYAGSSAGTVNGNVILEISGGNVSFAAAGSTDANAKINGNAVVKIDTHVSKVGAPKNGSVAGKTIYIANRVLSFEMDSHYDYYVVVTGGNGTPVFDGTTLKGFMFTDKNGMVCHSITVNGAEQTSENGIFALAEGKSEVSVPKQQKLSLMADAKYVSGYADGTFLPNGNLTRAEAITMLARLVADQAVLSKKIAAPYTDVPDGAWYQTYIGLFAAAGYLDTITADGGTKILPDAKITRGEFVEIARHVLRYISGRSFEVKQFPDVPSYHPYYTSIGEIGTLGIVGGYEDGTFRPDNNITRAEVVTIINRMLCRTPTGNAGASGFTDTAGHWGEGQIIMAANPSTVNGAVIWQVNGKVTDSGFTLLKDATLGEQIKALYNAAKTADRLYTISGVDEISNWQIENILYSESDYSTITGTKYYISPNGNDEADGKTPNTAWKTLAMTNAAVLQPGDGVLFERGGTWRGQLIAVSGVTYSAYGTGDKPRIYGSLQDYADETLWEKHEKYENVWKCTKIFTEDVGVMIFDTLHEHGNYNEIAGTKIRGDGFDYIDARCLKNDLEFFYKGGRVFLYSAENPGKRFDSIEIGFRTNLVAITGDNIVIDNLHFRYTGAHVVGTGNRKNITSKNCIYAYAGGSVLSGTTLYGNAFESYGGCDGWYAYNNWIYQIYDTGVTHQYTPTTGECIQKDVEYRGNVIEYCHWSIEYYNHDSTDGSARLVSNVDVSENICRMNGYGWGSRGRVNSSTMFCSAGITKNTENFVAKNNIFDRAAGNLINIGSEGDKVLQLEENLFVQSENGIMGHMKEGYVRNDANILKNLAANTVEKDPVIINNNDRAIIDNIKE